MIIMGYPGIGKSSVAKEDYRFIDLDSADRLIHGKYGRNKRWEEAYCNMALLLSKQGYIVFVSTHPEVRKRIIAKEKNPVLCYPNIALKDEWIKRLYSRYQDRKNRPTHNAWRRAKDHFDEDYDSLSKEKCNQLILYDMDYNLKKDILELKSYLESK